MKDEASQDKTNKIKEFGLSSLAVGNKKTVLVITFIIVIAGMLSYSSMPKENFPEVITPEIYVGVAYPGNPPKDIEDKIAEPLEQEINSITGVDEINSTSVQGYCSIQVKFDFSVEPKEAKRKVQDAVDIVKGDKDFPQDLPVEPTIFEMNFSELIPIMNINLSGDYSLEQLKEYAEYLEEEIEDLPEISKVDVRGVQDQEAKIEVDRFKMEALQVSFGDIERAVQGANFKGSGGDLKIDGKNSSVVINGEFLTKEDIESVIVKQEGLDEVYLGQVADIYIEPEQKDSYAREFGKQVVMLDVIKRAGENLLKVSDDILDVIEEAKKEKLPENLTITITNDQSDMTRTQVGELENSIFFGVILVVVVLMFFLGLRNAIFVGVAIPLSMFMSFFILGAAGVTLNVMVLFSLVLALGMLVDNGIVVVENIYRLMDEGYPPMKAARLGVGEVALPIIASTATTLAAFIPLAIWPGLMGEFMKFLPITLIIVLSSSLFVALVINPVLTSIWMKVGDPNPNKPRVLMVSGVLILLGVMLLFAEATALGNLLIIAGGVTILNVYVLTPATKVFQTRLIPRLESGYQRFLRFAITKWRPYVLLIGTFGLFVFSIILIAVVPPKVEFFPINEPQYLNVFIEKPIGTDIEETNKTAIDIENIVAAKLKKYERVYENENGEKDTANFLVESVIGQVGNGTSDPAQGPSLSNTPHKARVTVSFIEFQGRFDPYVDTLVNTSLVLEEIRDTLKGYSGALVTVDKNEAGPPVGKPINIEFSGDNYDSLLVIAMDAQQFINEANIPGIEELKLDVEAGKPEFQIQVDKKKAGLFNVTVFQVADAIRTALFGKELSTFQDVKDDFEIWVRLKDDQRYDADALMNTRITFRDQTNGQIVQVPISAVANKVETSTFSAVKRKDLDRVVTITSNVLVGYNANEVVQAIKKRMEGYDLTDGDGNEYKIDFTGQQEEQAKEMSFLGSALMIAVFLIFLIIVSQFNSVSTPLIILLSVLFSNIGVLLGLVIFRQDFIIIMTMIGIISLAGVVVNNAIVLIDYTNLIRARKRREGKLEDGKRLPFDQVLDSIVEGGKTRLRPVLLTAITTVLGLLPLATGFNINFYTLFSDYDPQIYVGGDNVIFWGPMSWAIIYGLTFATFLTLVIVPVMYSILNRLKYRFSKGSGL